MIKSLRQDKPFLIFQHSYQLYRQHFKSLFLLSFIGNLLLVLLCWGYTEPWLTQGSIVAPKLSLIFILTALGNLLLSATLIIKIYHYWEALPIATLNALGLALRAMPQLLIMLGVYCLIIVGGTLLLIVPGLYFAIAFMFSLMVYLTEHKSIYHSFNLSYKIIQGRWWDTLLVMAIPLLLNFIAVLCLFWFMAYWNFNLSPLQQNGLYLLSYALLQGIYLPFAYSVPVIWFNYLKFYESS
jgi:hypothetical protein